MVALMEGQEISIDDEAAWSAVTLLKGQVLEVHFASTNFHIQSDSWGAFLIRDVAHLPDGSMVVHVKFVGAEDPDVVDACLPIFNQGERRIHLCLGRPCLDADEEEKLHVTRIRIWTLSGFRECDYVTPDMWKAVGKWVKEKKPAAKGVEGDPPKEDRRRKPRGAVKPEPKKSRKPPASGTLPRAKPKAGGHARGKKPVEEEDEDDGNGSGTALTEEKKAQLRDRLKRIRSTLFQGGKETEKQDETEDEESFQLVGSSPEPSPCALEDGLTNGTGLEINKRELVKAEPSRKGALRRRKEEALSGSTSKNLRKQLAQRAVEVAKRRSKKNKKEKKGKDSDVKKLSLMLSKILTKGSDSKKKKKKRKRLKNGVIETCSDSSSKSSDESERMSSDEDLEAPVKKKSRDHPGSVLALLTSHVREQLEQGAAVDLPNDDGGVTSGVKVVTYFNLHLKPQYGQFQRELREMFTLASTLDQLRAGDIARVGDSLAGRFIALHQFLQDGHWGTAKHMELHPLEESSAAGPSIVLASRKHAKLVQKVQGLSPSGQWVYHPGKGRGRGRGDWYGDGKGDGKSDPKGKGKKGKGRGGKWKGHDAHTTDWEKNKDKAEDKK